MATKVISTYYSGFYSVAQNYTSVTITAAGDVAGDLVVNANNTTVVNYGRLRGPLSLSSSYFITLFNEPGAIISGFSYGVQAQGVSVQNRSLIHGGRYGVLSVVFGGSVANGLATYTNAQISGYFSGIALFGGSSTVTNFGSVTSNSGYAINAYGKITNGSGGVDTALVAGAGGVVANSITSITNFGTVRGSTLSGVELKGGGGVTNGSVSDSEALIAGYTSGVAIGTLPAAIANFGTIRSTSATVGHYGVFLSDGGEVINGGLTDTSALVEGYAGVGVSGGAGSVGNFGSIVGQGFHQTGVSLLDGGTVSNGAPTDRGAAIAGYSGVSVGSVADPSADAYVTNAGTIRGNGDAASAGVVGLLQSKIVLINGSATNATALIAGYTGVALTGASTLINFGSIVGEGSNSGPGLYLSGSDSISVTNGAPGHGSALIEGYVGITCAAANASITNFGAIDGLNGVAVILENASDTLAVEAGSAFIGSIFGGGGTLELANGIGTLTSLQAGGNVTVSGSMAATTFTNFGTMKIDAGASFALVGASGTIGAGHALDLLGTLSGTGTLALTGGTATFGTGASLIIAKVSQTGGTASFLASTLTVSDVWTQTAGTVTVATGDRLNFSGTGNTFSGILGGAGTVEFTGGTDALTGATLSATLMVVNGAAVTVLGTLNLTKTLDVTSTLTVAAAGVTLSGKGILNLNNATTSIVKGATTATTLTNTSDRIIGEGQLGDGQLKIINGGTIDGSLTGALTINTGTNAVTNTGLIENTNTGGTTITGALSNTGTLTVTDGTLTVDGAVTGAGTVKISVGTADFASTFTQNVAFTGTTGILELAKSQTYTGQVTGLSTTGKSSLDLLDITFTAGTTKATYSGTATSGTLTVTDGTHTAHITLEGNYVGHTFTTSSDGHGGTTVVDPTVPKSGGHVVPLVAAMAGFGAGGTALTGAPANDFTRLGLFAAPA